MHLFEMKHLPKKADKAHIEWNSEIMFPERTEKMIVLPKNNSTVYYTLQEGRQFLLWTQGKAWFGGTDEEPFLVELQTRAIDNYTAAGGDIEIFYNSLVPDNVRKISRETETPYKRQGDIFAARFCGEKYFEKRLSNLLGTKINEGEGSVFGTRHVARGLLFNVGQSSLFKGTIEAPDHKPLVLDDALYLLGQTQYIVNPKNAD